MFGLFEKKKSSQTVYDFEVKTIQGETTTLAPFKGKVMLIVNVASRCGFTPQYKGLEALYEKYKSEGLEVLGFPCNQFGEQEAGTDAEIQSFCDLSYKITFPMFSKIEVNGPGAHPLYVFLKSQEKGLLGTESVKWNFTKFLVGRDGTVLSRFAPQTEPESLAKDIEKALKG